MLLRSQKFTKVTHPRSKAAFGSRRNLIAASQCPSAHVDIYLNSSETYTKFKLTGKRFVRLKVASYRLNELWSIDLANMQKLAASNNGIRYLFVAVDVLSRYFFCSATHQPEKFASTRGSSLQETLPHFVGQKVSTFIPPKAKQSLHWRKEIFDLSNH